VQGGVGIVQGGVGIVYGGVGIVHGGVGDVSVQGGLSLSVGPPGVSFWPEEPPVDPEGNEETKPPPPTPYKK
jgi:hypothetical protein